MFQGYNFPIPLSSTNMGKAKAATTSDDDGGKYTQKEFIEHVFAWFCTPFCKYIHLIYFYLRM